MLPWAPSNGFSQAKLTTHKPDKLHMVSREGESSQRTYGMVCRNIETSHCDMVSTQSKTSQHKARYSEKVSK